ncbi:MAG: glycoside hydrolase family 31 protein, partial [Candidatus Alcyoniella australis]|nr:glycoside hydrolase family 31 protein [Candidatus Alcyoniella australis]
STDLGLRSAIISLLQSSFLGFPVWGSDTGGYHHFIDREVFARWIEFSCFCPLMEIGGRGDQAPWNMPTQPHYDEQMIEIYRDYVTLHHELQDYSYQYAQRAHQSGAPIARPLVFDWPDDPQVREIWDEYLYGDEILVAPVWRVGQRSRSVYLPQGEWTDYWDRDTTYSGPLWIEADAPLERIPLYLRDQ